MDVSPPAAPASPAVSAPTAPTSERIISSDFETFLRMLTAQMENQDPLDPLDSADYAVQLATFSNVEQQVLTNDLLTAMMAQMQTTGLAQAASWVGMEARILGPVHFDGDPITVIPSPPVGAETADLVIRNEFGTEIAREPVGLTGGPLEWAGLDSTGTPFPTGTYSFEVVGYEGDTPTSSTPAEVYATVTEVSQGASGLVVMFQGGHAVPATSITSLRSA